MAVSGQLPLERMSCRKHFILLVVLCMYVSKGCHPLLDSYNLAVIHTMSRSQLCGYPARTCVNF